eukprot:746332-Hanusia_phi.AAC.13
MRRGNKKQGSTSPGLASHGGKQGGYPKEEDRWHAAEGGGPVCDSPPAGCSAQTRRPSRPCGCPAASPSLTRPASNPPTASSPPGPWRPPARPGTGDVSSSAAGAGAVRQAAGPRRSWAFQSRDLTTSSPRSRGPSSEKSPADLPGQLSNSRTLELSNSRTLKLSNSRTPPQEVSLPAVSL